MSTWQSHSRGDSYPTNVSLASLPTSFPHFFLHTTKPSSWPGSYFVHFNWTPNTPQKLSFFSVHNRVAPNFKTARIFKYYAHKVYTVYFWTLPRVQCDLQSQVFKSYSKSLENMSQKLAQSNSKNTKIQFSQSISEWELWN